MASALFFLDLKGKVNTPSPKPMYQACRRRNKSATQLTQSPHQTLLARNYRGDIPMSAVEKFPILLSEAEEESSAVPPCFSHEGINVCHPFSKIYT